jgi:hypothetical protein
VTKELEIGVLEEMLDIGLVPGEKVVSADDIMPVLQKAFAQVGTQKTCSARDQNSFAHLLSS